VTEGVLVFESLKLSSRGRRSSWARSWKIWVNRLLAEGVESTARKRVTKMMGRVSGMAIPPRCYRCDVVICIQLDEENVEFVIHR
jgi:hypothetical protein